VRTPCLHVRGVYTPAPLPAWARPGVTVPAPPYAGEWSRRSGGCAGVAHPGGKFPGGKFTPRGI